MAEGLASLVVPGLHLIGHNALEQEQELVRGRNNASELLLETLDSRQCGGMGSHAIVMVRFGLGCEGSFDLAEGGGGRRL
jgi:hypothetical protein